MNGHSPDGQSSWGHKLVDHRLAFQNLRPCGGARHARAKVPDVPHRFFVGRRSGFWAPGCSCAGFLDGDKTELASKMSLTIVVNDFPREILRGSDWGRVRVTCSEGGGYR